MNTMNHKGYTARVEFDERDNIFVGRVLGLHTMIRFHGETVAELLRVPVAVHGATLVAAQAAGKSLNQWAMEVLEEATHV